MSVCRTSRAIDRRSSRRKYRLAHVYMYKKSTQECFLRNPRVRTYPRSYVTIARSVFSPKITSIDFSPLRERVYRHSSLLPSGSMRDGETSQWKLECGAIGNRRGGQCLSVRMRVSVWRHERVWVCVYWEERVMEGKRMEWAKKRDD